MTKKQDEMARIWAYVHKQLPEVERIALESSMAEDPTLHEAVVRVCALHERLGQWIPAKEQTPEELENIVLEALDQE